MNQNVKKQINSQVFSRMITNVFSYLKERSSAKIYRCRAEDTTIKSLIGYMTDFNIEERPNVDEAAEFLMSEFSDFESIKVENPKAKISA